jgi:hypothetical protein
VHRLTKILLAALVATPLVAAAAEDAKPATLGPVTVSGLVDAYYTANLGKAQTEADPLRAYDGPTGFRLNYAQVSLAMDASPAGFRLDLGYGPESFSATNFFVLQAYGSFKLGKTTLDFGRFVTPAGAEAFQTNLNWLYSRSLLYTWAIPGAHQGARLTVPLSEQLSVAGYIVNGWDGDSTVDLLGGDYNVLSPYKTGILAFAWAGEASTAALNLYYGQQPGAVDTRFLADVVLAHKFGTVSANLQADYGQEGDNNWYGVAVSGAYDRPKYRLAARAEWFADPDGFRTSDTTGFAGGVDYYEFTLGAAYKVGNNGELRAEYRIDLASEDSLAGTSSWNTFTIGALAWF